MSEPIFRHQRPGRLPHRITRLFPGDRECTVVFDECWSVVEYDDEPALMKHPGR